MGENMQQDFLGNGFQQETLHMGTDAEGEVVATLVQKKTDAPSKKAVLYIHGYVDYFFQTEMAEKYIERGFNFYALDLRKYGRSLLSHQTPNFCRQLSEYFEEIDDAVRIIRQRDGNTHLVLSGHSTGGLTSALFAHHRREENIVDALFLNSPFFDFNENRFLEIFLIPMIAKTIGAIRAKQIVPGRSLALYAHSVHKNFHGEWDFNFDWKPIEGFPARAGWLRAIYRGQQELQNGLNISCPVLVMHSQDSINANQWNEDFTKSDSVLDVTDIDRFADGLGREVTKIPVKGGLHDLMLSEKAVRNRVFEELFNWLGTTGTPMSRNAESDLSPGT
jgi:alpha-beta hydrolase superfamily lysophospholipase